MPGPQTECVRSVEGIQTITLTTHIISFFDRENIYDVMDTLNEVGVNKKAARFWFKLNEATEIRVKCGGGLTDTAIVGDCVGQGTAGASLASALNLDSGLQSYFSKSNDEMKYGEIRLEYFAYQDDIAKPNKGVLEAQIANMKIQHLFDEKGLDAHPDKTSFLLLGSKKCKEKIEKDLERNPLTFGDFLVKRKKSEKYLGQMIHEDEPKDKSGFEQNIRPG